MQILPNLAKIGSEVDEDVCGNDIGATWVLASGATCGMDAEP